MKKKALFLFGMGLLWRLSFAFFGELGHSVDQSCFLGWANQLQQFGIGNFYQSTGFCDYPPGYLYILYLIGWLIKDINGVTPFSALMIRLPAILADLGIAYFLMKLARERRGERTALITAAAVLFNPLFLLNSAVWAQIDSVWCLFLLMAIGYREEKVKSAVFLAISALIKPQALLFFPLMAVFYFDKEKPLLSYLKVLGTGLLVFVIGALPFCKGNFMLILEKYFGTMTGGYPYATVNAFNVYGLLGANWVKLEEPFLFATYGFWGNVMIGVGLILGFLSFLWWKKGPWLSACVMMTTLFLFGPMMHERYWIPAIFLLLAGYGEEPRNGLLASYSLASLANFMNMGIVLLSAWNEFTKIPDLTVGLFSALTLGAGALVYVSIFQKEKSCDRT